MFLSLQSEKTDTYTLEKGHAQTINIVTTVQNRHQFAAESADELQAWIRAIQGAIEEARVSRRKPGRKRHLEGKSPDLSTSSQIALVSA
ncbi:UNVERIFIED_CONTAM: hypothetical protein NCL1_12602 [Trichonephila clavipes]